MPAINTSINQSINQSINHFIKSIHQSTRHVNSSFPFIESVFKSSFNSIFKSMHQNIIQLLLLLLMLLLVLLLVLLVLLLPDIFTRTPKKKAWGKKTEFDIRTRPSQTVTHPSTDRTRRCLTSVIRWVLVLWSVGQQFNSRKYKKQIVKRIFTPTASAGNVIKRKKNQINA